MLDNFLALACLISFYLSYSETLHAAGGTGGTGGTAGHGGTGGGAAPASSCVGCHRPGGLGIENAHPFGDVTLNCVDCHGGNPEAMDAESAHVSIPENLGDGIPISCNDPNLASYVGRACSAYHDCGERNACNDGQCDPCRTCMDGLECKDGVCCLNYRSIRRLSSDQLNHLPAELIQFINPGDHRVAHRGCGSSNGKAGESGCHQEVVDSARLSVMETFAGHYNLSRFLAGLQGRTAEVGVVERSSVLEGDEAQNPLRTEQIRPLTGPLPDRPRLRLSVSKV